MGNEASSTSATGGADDDDQSSSVAPRGRQARGRSRTRSTRSSDSGCATGGESTATSGRRGNRINAHKTANANTDAPSRRRQPLQTKSDEVMGSVLDTMCVAVASRLSGRKGSTVLDMALSSSSEEEDSSDDDTVQDRTRRRHSRRQGYADRNTRHAQSRPSHRRYDDDDTCDTRSTYNDDDVRSHDRSATTYDDDEYTTATEITRENNTKPLSPRGKGGGPKRSVPSATLPNSVLKEGKFASSSIVPVNIGRCHFTKENIGRAGQHYEGLTLSGSVLLMLSSAMKLEGCPTICDEDLRRIQEVYPVHYSRLPDELLLSSGWRRISKFCHFSNHPIPDGTPFFHSKERLHANGGYYFLIASALGMVSPIDVEPITRDHLVLLETDYPAQCDSAPPQLIRDHSTWLLVDKFCFFSGGPINSVEDVYYEANLDGSSIYMLAFLNPTVTAEQLYAVGAEYERNVPPEKSGIFESVLAVSDVEKIYNLTEEDFDDLSVYHLGPCRALPPYMLQPSAWKKIFPEHFCAVRQKALERAKHYERIHSLSTSLMQQIFASTNESAPPAASYEKDVSAFLGQYTNAPPPAGQSATLETSKEIPVAIEASELSASILAPAGFSPDDVSGPPFRTQIQQTGSTSNNEAHQGGNERDPYLHFDQRQLEQYCSPPRAGPHSDHLPIYTPHAHRGYKPDLALRASNNRIATSPTKSDKDYQQRAKQGSPSKIATPSPQSGEKGNIMQIVDPDPYVHEVLTSGFFKEAESSVKFQNTLQTCSNDMDCARNYGLQQDGQKMRTELTCFATNTSYEEVGDGEQIAPSPREQHQVENDDGGKVADIEEVQQYYPPSREAHHRERGSTSEIRGGTKDQENFRNILVPTFPAHQLLQQAPTSSWEHGEGGGEGYPKEYSDDYCGDLEGEDSNADCVDDPNPCSTLYDDGCAQRPVPHLSHANLQEVEWPHEEYDKNQSDDGQSATSNTGFSSGYEHQEIAREEYTTLQQGLSNVPLRYNGETMHEKIDVNYNIEANLGHGFDLRASDEQHNAAMVESYNAGTGLDSEQYYGAQTIAESGPSFDAVDEVFLRVEHASPDRGGPQRWDFVRNATQPKMLRETQDNSIHGVHHADSHTAQHQLNYSRYDCSTFERDEFMQTEPGRLRVTNSSREYNPAFDLDEGDMDTFRGTSFHRVDVSAQLGNTVDDYAHSDSQWIDNRSYIDEDEESSASEQENEPPWNHLSPTSGTASSVVSSDWSDSENLNSRRALILKMAKARMKNRPNTELSDCNSVASLVSSVARVSGLQVSNVEVDFSKDLD